LNLFRERLGKIPSLRVDTGYFTADDRSTHGRLRPDAVTKNLWVGKSYGEFAVDVLNLSSHDLRYFADSVASPKTTVNKEVEPFFDRLVSANTVDAQTGSQIVKPFIVREVASRQGGAKPLKIAFIGLTETTPDAPRGLKFLDPVEAAKRTVPEARKVADIVIVLAKIESQQEIARVAREAPGIDVILNGNSGSLEAMFTAPVQIGSTFIAYTPYETRMLGELRVYRGAQGKFTTKVRFVTLDETLVPEDPGAKQVVADAARAETETRNNSAKILESWLESSRLRVIQSDAGSLRAGSSAAFVTSSACSQCHTVQYLNWSNSAHAHATDPLPARALEFEADCLDCHATGAKFGDATDKLKNARLQNVQCEQCHGPGSNHVAKPGKGYGRIASMQTVCASCHTNETSPGFDLQTAWAKIKH
jgi:hypothetical protein